MRLEHGRAARVVLHLVRAEDPVAHKRHVLRIGAGRVGRKHVVALDENRAVVHLDEHVAPVVRPQPVPDHARALRHPVEPDAAVPAIVVDAVVAYRHVHRAEQLEARHVRAAVALFPVAVEDLAVLDRRERRAEGAVDAALPAFGHLAAAHDVVSHAFPPVARGALDRVVVAPHERAGVVELVAVLAEGDAVAGGSAHLAVLDDPPPAPVRAHHAHLLAVGRAPVGRGVLEDDAAQGDVVAVLLDRVEARGTGDEFRRDDVGVLLERREDAPRHHARNQRGTARRK